MLAPELLKKVKMIELTTRKMVNDLMSGSYRSHFKGHGVQFSEHRLYVAGDDVRHIDWKVSARSRDPVIKKYEEERELTVLLVVDVSASKSFGSARKLKSEVAAEIAGMLAYAAIHTGDKVGALLFAGETELIIPPKKGKKHILRIIRDVLAYKAKSKGTNLAGAIESADRLLKHGGIVFILSDFMAKDYKDALTRLSRRNDVVAVTISDERENEIPSVGQLLIVDPETGTERLIDTSSYAFKKWFKEFTDQRAADTKAAFKGGQTQHLNILTKEDYGEAVVRFFQARSRRRR